MLKLLCHKINGVAAYNTKAVYAECQKHERSIITVEPYSEAAEISDNQRKWWKGVLLPALSKYNGEHVRTWEIRLKLAVMPDEFQPEKTIVCGQVFYSVPSITKLSMKKLNTLIEGAVDFLRNEPYNFDWVTLPDSSLKKP